MIVREFMKRLIIILLFLSLPSICLSGMIIQKFTSAGGSCDTQSLDSNNTSYNDNTNIIYDEGASVGQSFQVSTAADVYSIVVRIDSVQSTPALLDLRIGTTSDLSSYTATVTEESVSGTGEVEFVFGAGSRPSLSTLTTYYFGVRNASVYANRVELSTQSSSVYADGTEYRSNAGVDAWNIGDNVVAYDLYFKINLCD